MRKFQNSLICPFSILLKGNSIHSSKRLVKYQTEVSRMLFYFILAASNVSCEDKLICMCINSSFKNDSYNVKCFKT